MRRRQHAVVIGASMSGLFAARVLSEEFDKVTVLDRDGLPDGVAQRRGVPQGRHAHALLPRGRQVLDELFPGLTDELIAMGAPTTHNLDELHFEVLGHVLSQHHVDDPDPEMWSIQASRPLLEGRVRDRIRALGTVELRDGVAVSAPRISPDRSRVVGVEMTPSAGGDLELLPADLVVDASGRSGRAVTWLSKWGYDAPPVEEVPVRVSYVSQLLRMPEGRSLKRQYIVGPRPGRPVGLALFAMEDRTWVLTVICMGEQRCATQHQAMLDTVLPLVPDELREALPLAEELTEPVAFGYPTSRRHRYEKASRLPHGFLVTGDAVCSFNPIYGQGMTVAAVEAMALRRALQGDDRHLARTFFRGAARPVAAAWQLATGSDLAMPELGLTVPRQARVANAWVDRMLRAAGRDDDAAVAFLRVTSLIDPPAALFRPRAVARVVRPRTSAELVGGRHAMA